MRRIETWAVDVGNTRVKAGRFDPAGTLLDVRSGAPDEPLLLRGRARVLSVSAGHLARFLAANEGPGVSIEPLALPLAVELRVDAPAEVGVDRLANAAAAWERARGVAVVVDVGTAITVDAVAADGAFLGGAIAPGPAAATAGLRAGAPHLPDPGPGSPASALGRRTIDAMAGALRFGFAGLVDRLVEEVAAAAGFAGAAAFLTGGGASVLGPASRTAFAHVPHLTLEGIDVLGRRADGVAEEWTRASP